MPNLEIIYKPLQQEVILESLSLLSAQDVNQLQREAKYGYAAIYGRMVVGILLYEKYNNYLVMDKIAVSEQYRRQGIATGMLKMLCKLADVRKYEVFFSFSAEGKQSPFYRFVASFGTFHLERQTGFEAVLQAEDLKLLQERYAGKGKETNCFFDLSRKPMEEFLEQMEKTYPAIAEELRHENQAYDKNLCCYMANKNGVQAVSLVKREETELELKLLYALPEKGVLAAEALMQSIRNLNVEQLLPLRVSPTGENAVKIIKKLCPSYRIEKWIYMAYYMGK